MRNLKIQQFKIFNKIKKIYRNFNGENFQPTFDTPIYFASYAGNSFGMLKIRKFIGKKDNFFYKLSIFLKEFISSVYLINNIKKYKLRNNANKMIVTWAFKKNFHTDGSLNDKYLNYNSKKSQDILWFVIYMDNDLPNKVDKNIIVYKWFSKKKFNIFILIKIISLNLKFLLKDFYYFLFSITSQNSFSYYLAKTIGNLITQDIKQILILYEGQPFQNNLIREIKKRFNIKVIGYIHAPPLSFPINYVKKRFSPDKIFVNGNDQKKFFLQNGWSNKNIHLCNSFRFLKGKHNLKSKIFLPIKFKSEEAILNSLDYMINKLNYNLKNFIIKAHPASEKSEKSILLQKKIFIKIKKSKYKKNNFFNLPVFIGASGGISEALERGYKVMHICEFPIIDFYSDKIWNSIKTKQLSPNLFLYEIKKKGNIIRFGNKPKSLDTFFRS